MSAEARELFQGAQHAAVYKMFRPAAPTRLMDKIIPYLTEMINPPFEQAVDVGCGSGQSTQLLAPYFQKAIGIDVSKAQVEEAKRNEKLPNITYAVGEAESLPIETGSTQLITVAQAAHWLDLPAFYREVDRILVPGGVLAIFSHIRPEPVYKTVSEQLQCHLNHMFDVVTGKYWHQGRKLIDDHYKDLTLPYEDSLRDDSIVEEKEYSVAEVIGYIRSWSAFQAYKKDNPKDAEESLAAFQRKYLEIMEEERPAEEVKIIMQWKYCLLLSRKPM